MKHPTSRGHRRANTTAVYNNRKHYNSIAPFGGQRNQDTPCACSCPMCGNPRRNPWNKPKEALTPAERRANITLQEEVAA
jgi:hypothetical protein